VNSLKKILTVGLILIFVMSITAVSYAGTEVTPLNKTAGKGRARAVSEDKGRSDLLAGPNKKMMRGIKNFLFGWTEIPKTIVSKTKESNPLLGITVGTLKGITKAFPKTVSGIADVATFPVGGYDDPLIEPGPLEK
jgi:putative exosortase-associated protein (TIGR04073 family)